MKSCISTFTRIRSCLMSGEVSLVNIRCFVVHEAIGCDQKSFKLTYRWDQLLSGIQAKGHLPRVSRQSLIWSANDMDDNEIALGAMYGSPGTCLTAEDG